VRHFQKETDSEPISVQLIPSQPWKRGLISAFIIFNIVAIGFGSSRPVAEQSLITRFVNPYLVWTRLLQNWPLFAPEPRRFIVKYRAEITFRNHAMTVWERPYPPDWDFFARHLSYQFQKWDTGSNNLEKPIISDFLWLDFAHYLEKLYANPANPPDHITFFRSRAAVPPPNETGYAQPDFSHPQWIDDRVHLYTVKDGKLQ
jgi:hypothetical protein